MDEGFRIFRSENEWYWGAIIDDGDKIDVDGDEEGPFLTWQEAVDDLKAYMTKEFA